MGLSTMQEIQVVVMVVKPYMYTIQGDPTTKEGMARIGDIVREKVEEGPGGTLMSYQIIIPEEE